MDPRIKELAKYGIAFIVLLILFFGGTFILKGFLGTEYPMMVVVSESMVPTLGVGDYIVVGSISDFSKVVAAPEPIGDIIVFLKPGSTDEYIVHRAIKKIEQGGKLSYVTKGDNNAFQDGIPVPSGNVVGKVIGNIPIVGYFSLFIKTIRGFSLVIGLMALAFFIDYILPPKKPSQGRFPIVTVIPLVFAPLAVASFWFLSDNHVLIDSASLLVWYFTCFLLPLSFHDDDSGVMLWLYHLVLVMIPISSDIVWWTTGITPSRWWYAQGSTIPINWLLLKETPLFGTAFDMVLRMIIPGIVIFTATLYFKRKGWGPILSLHSKFRRATLDAPKVDRPESTSTA